MIIKKIFGSIFISTIFLLHLNNSIFAAGNINELREYENNQNSNSEQESKKTVKWEDSPLDVVEGLGSMTSNVQNTQLDSTSGEGIKSTLENVGDNSTSYIDWIIFVGLSIGVILIIFNGLLLVLSPAKDSAIQKVKERMTLVIIGILILTGSAVIIKIVISIIDAIT